MPPALIADPDAVTAEWLTEVLRHADRLGPDGAVTGFEATPVGTGQVGDSVRYALTVDPVGPATPATVVAKFTAADPASRATGVTMRNYEIEARFYQELRDRVAITTPPPLFVDVVVETGDFVLVMDDLAPAEQGDQIAGCTVDQAALALSEAAALHAPLWADPSLTEMAWLDRTSDESIDMGAALLPMLWEGFVDRYGDRLAADLLSVGERLLPRIRTYLGHQPGPWAVAHGDYRLDNMLFGTDPGVPPLTVVDWQTVVHGPPMVDVAYFLGAGLPEDVRAGVEEGLVRGYHRDLIDRGVEGYGWDRCWEDYRRYAFSGYLMAVGASMLVAQTDRGDEMFLTMARRHGHQALALNSQELLDLAS